MQKKGNGRCATHGKYYGGCPGAVLDPNIPETFWPLEKDGGDLAPNKPPFALNHRCVRAIFSPTHPVQPPAVSRFDRFVFRITTFRSVLSHEAVILHRFAFRTCLYV